MKLFVKKFTLFIGIPLILILGIYLISDPFKTLHKFSLKEFSTVNRDYLSTELYLRNRKTQHYNSFIFSSSRGCGINTYKWKHYLPAGSNQFLFQAWGETIIGINQKLNFIEQNHDSIDNVLILLDIPTSFSDVQQPTKALDIKHYLTSGKSRFYNEYHLFYAFLKPTEIFKSAKEIFIKPNFEIGFDTITNDWEKWNKESCNKKPIQDSTLNKTKFGDRPQLMIYSDRVIKPELEFVLKDIKRILRKHNTNYKIIITPDYNQVCINKTDLQLIQTIFGVQNVFNYSGKNNITEDKYNFMDIGHFDLIVGWQILEDIYGQTN